MNKKDWILMNKKDWILMNKKKTSNPLSVSYQWRFLHEDEDLKKIIITCILKYEYYKSSGTNYR